MEIKQGDTVRESKAAPKMFRCGFNHVYTVYISKVLEVDDGNAIIEMTMANMQSQERIIIPTKYLVKVDAEAKEAKFKVGDVVRIKPTADKLHQGYQNGYAWLSERDEYLGRVASVKEIWCDGSIILSIRNNMLWEPIDLEPYTEPTEQTEAQEGARIRQMETELDDFRKAELDRMLHPEKPTFEVMIDNVAMNWQRYEADLAKELAISYAKRGKSPLDAVAAAKEITKRLKQK